MFIINDSFYSYFNIIRLFWSQNTKSMFGLFIYPCISAVLKNYSMCSSNVIARAQQLKIGSNDPRSSYQNPPKQWQKNACILLLSEVDRPLGHIELKVCSSTIRTTKSVIFGFSCYHFLGFSSKLWLVKDTVCTSWKDCKRSQILWQFWWSRLYVVYSSSSGPHVTVLTIWRHLKCYH